MADGARNGAAPWKWLASFLAGVMLAGFPAAVTSLKSPSRSDLDELRAEVVAGQIQAARIEERLALLIADNQQSIKELRADLKELQSGLRR